MDAPLKTRGKSCDHNLYIFYYLLMEDDDNDDAPVNMFSSACDLNMIATDKFIHIFTFDNYGRPQNVIVIANVPYVFVRALYVLCRCQYLWYHSAFRKL